MTSRDENRSVGLVAAVPVAALVVVFTIQFFTAHTTVLTPWKGGGFGMFSTVDVDTGRMVMLYLEFDGEEYPVAVPDRFAGEVESLRPMPTEERTEAFARRLASMPWVELSDHRPGPLVRFGDRARPAVDRHWVLRQPLHDPEDVVVPDGVRVQVWGRKFESDEECGGTLTRFELQDVYVAGPESS